MTRSSRAFGSRTRRITRSRAESSRGRNATGDTYARNEIGINRLPTPVTLPLALVFAFHSPEGFPLSSILCVLTLAKRSVFGCKRLAHHLLLTRLRFPDRFLRVACDLLLARFRL